MSAKAKNEAAQVLIKAMGLIATASVLLDGTDEGLAADDINVRAAELVNRIRDHRKQQS